MEAALTGFGGHIPAALVKKLNISNTSYTRTKWVEFPDKYGGVYLLEPTSPLYKQIGSDFIKLQMDIYGTDHIYQTDTYNEMDPKTSDPDYLKASSGAVYNAMVVIHLAYGSCKDGFLSKFWQDKEIKAYLEGVPKGMIVLDLAANSRPSNKNRNLFMDTNLFGALCWYLGEPRYVRQRKCYWGWNIDCFRV